MTTRFFKAVAVDDPPAGLFRMFTLAESMKRVAERSVYATGSEYVTGRDEIEALLEAAASQGLQVTLYYKHLTDGKEVINRVEPYSYRYRRSRKGPGTWKFFYGYHPSHGSIEMYLVRNIIAARVTTKGYAPRWPVEIGQSANVNVSEAG